MTEKLLSRAYHKNEMLDRRIRQHSRRGSPAWDGSVKYTGAWLSAARVIKGVGRPV